MNNTRKSASFALIIFALSLAFFSTQTVEAAVVTEKTALAQLSVSHAYPVRVIIPSIKLNSPIQGMGVNTKGELDVPSGKTNNVGWYKYGTKPGDVGSAVLDAHVFAAFAKLNKVTPGSDIYIVMSDGTKLHFKVDDAKTYALKNLSPYALFTPTSNRSLNLITCAGKLTADRSTYSHRLIVYTSFVGVAA